MGKRSIHAQELHRQNSDISLPSSRRSFPPSSLSLKARQTRQLFKNFLRRLYSTCEHLFRNASCSPWRYSVNVCPNFISDLKWDKRVHKKPSRNIALINTNEVIAHSKRRSRNATRNPSRLMAERKRRRKRLTEQESRNVNKIGENNNRGRIFLAPLLLHRLIPRPANPRIKAW